MTTKPPGVTRLDGNSDLSNVTAEDNVLLQANRTGRRIVASAGRIVTQGGISMDQVPEGSVAPMLDGSTLVKYAGGITQLAPPAPPRPQQ